MPFEDQPLALFLLVAAAVVAATLVGEALVGGVLTRALRHRPLAVGILRRLRGPVRLALATIAVNQTRQAIELPVGFDSLVWTAVRVAGPIAVGWLAVRSIHALADEAVRRVDVDQADNLRARQLQTQLVVARRVAAVVVTAMVVIATARSFEAFRGIGTTLLASAGLVGVIIGVAGRSTIGNLAAGVQIAISSPLRLDDVVVVEGEFGRVEQLSLTHVVVRLWDQRRLVLPCLHVVEHPFENWTHRTSDLLGTVLLHADPALDVDELRAQVDQVVAAHPAWDGRVARAQVVDSTPASMVVRVVVSAHDANDAWELRCDLREALLAWLHRDRPEALPRVRVLAGPTDRGERNGVGEPAGRSRS